MHVDGVAHRAGRSSSSVGDVHLAHRGHQIHAVADLVRTLRNTPLASVTLIVQQQQQSNRTLTVFVSRCGSSPAHSPDTSGMPSCRFYCSQTTRLYPGFRESDSQGSRRWKDYSARAADCSDPSFCRDAPESCLGMGDFTVFRLCEI